MIRPLLMLAAAAMMATGAVAAGIDIGPAVGSKAPPLQATDAAGAPTTLKAISGPKGTVLVFFRSAKWCPYCQAQLISLKEAPEKLAQRGYTIAAISYDAPATLAEFRDKRGINYPLLSDAGSRTIDAFGLRDPQYKPDSMAFGVPQPAIFVMAPDGTVRARLAEAGFKSRPPLEAVLAAIDSLPKR